MLKVSLINTTKPILSFICLLIVCFAYNIQPIYSATKKNLKPNWINKNSYQDSNYYYVPGSYRAQSLTMARDQAVSQAKQRFAYLCYEAAKRDIDVGYMVKRVDGQLEEYRVDEAFVKVVDNHFGDGDLYKRFYEDDGYYYTVWVILRFSKAKVRAMMLKVHEIIDNMPRPPTVVICVANNPEVSTKNKRFSNLENKIKKEFKKFRYNFVKDPKTNSDYPIGVHPSLMLKTFKFIYRNTPVKIVLWCVVDHSAHKIEATKRNDEFWVGTIKLTIQEIVLEPGIIRRSFSRTLKVNNGRSRKQVLTESLKRLIENFKLEEEDFSRS